MTYPTRSKEGRVALVTGAARGLGLGFAQRLAAEGAMVVAVDREDISSLAEQVSSTRAAQVSVFRADVANEREVTDLVGEVHDRFGRCDIVVNNAGISSFGDIESLSLADVRKMMSVNFESAFLVSRGFAGMMKSQRYGRIVNLSSDTVGLTMKGLSHYLASKSAVIGLTRGLANDLGEYDITVNCIAPGLTRSPNTEAQFADTDAFERFVDRQSIKRSGEPRDLAGLLAFLTSEEAGLLTGQTIIVDGGALRAL